MSKRKWYTKALYTIVALAMTAGLLMVPATVGAQPTDVWVDDSWTSQADVDVFDPTLIWDTDAFDTIQEGVNAVAVGGTVNVRAGTYTPTDLTPGSDSTGELTINKEGLTLKSTDGPTETIIEAKVGNTGSILIAASNVTLDGFTIKGTSESDFPTGCIYMNVDGTTGVTIENNIIEWTGSSASTVAGIVNKHGFSVKATITNNTISGFCQNVALSPGFEATIGPNNTIKDSANDGIWVGSNAVVTITGNTITGNDEGICIGGNDVTVSENDISGNVKGMKIYTSVTDLTIRYNDITGNTLDGIKIESALDATNAIECNNIVGNVTYGVNNTSGTEVNVEANYWGDPGGPGADADGDLVFGDDVSANVDYTPWNQWEITHEQVVDPYLDPDIAYNVKTAEETFIVMDDSTGTPVCGALVWNWNAARRCGTGVVTVVAGGNPNLLDPTIPGNNFITVRMDTKGDCIITALVDDDSDPTTLPVQVSAEKKWGEIWCTELVKDPVNQYKVIETVKASFLWGDCTTVEYLVAEDAVVDWWLMDIGAQAAIEALEAALGDDPCDDDGGCGTYTSGFFSYDIDGLLGIEVDEVFDSPRAALLAIYAANTLPVGNAIAPNLSDADLTHEQTTSDFLGKTFVTVTLTAPTSAILVTLTDYPIDLAGENAVCVQHETWIVPPPPTVEKFPLIAWVGEKVVVEWNLGEGYDGDDEVKWTREAPSVGVFAESGYYAEDAWTYVDDDGVARVVVHSDKSGKMNILASVVGEHPTLQQGFIVYFLAFESVELKNIDSADIPNPDWDTAGEIVSEMEVGASDYLRVRVKGYFVDPDPEFQSTRPVGVLDSDGDGTPDFVLPAGRWVLPDDWNTLAGGAFWQVQKPHWDLMDELDDLVRSDLDITVSSAFGERDEEMGDYDNAWEVTQSVNSPSNSADWPVIGPFSTAQPCTALQWVTTPDAVIADGEFGTTRNTVVPNYACNEFDAVMPPARLYVVADSGTLSTEDKGDIYYDEYLGDRYYTFPYYRQEIPASELLNPYYGEGPAGYRWDSWDIDPVNAPVGVKGPYDFYEGLPLWAFDYTVINNSFGLDIDEDDEQLLGVYTDNHGEAWAEFTMTTIGTTIIKALATYPFLVGDFVPVVSNEVTKTAVDLKEVKVAVETVDEIRDLLYVFVRNYDGTPATCEEVEWAVDGPYGTIEELYEGDEGTSCYNECLDVTCIRDIAVGSRSAQGCTRVMTADEITKFTGAYIDATRVLSDTGTLLFDPAADEDPADYAIAGIRVLSSLGEDVDILIKVHDCWEGEEVIMLDDQVLLFGEPELDNPAVADGLDHCLAVVVMVYNFDNATKTWSWYNPDWPAASNTIDTLYKGKAYWVKVSANCTLLYGNQSYDLTTGWNNIPWLGY